MIKRQLADQLGKRLDLSRGEAEQLIDQVTGVFTQELTTRHSLSLPGVGRLTIHQSPERTITDISTKNQRVIGPRSRVKFQPTAEIKQALKGKISSTPVIEPEEEQIPITVTSHRVPAVEPPLEIIGSIESDASPPVVAQSKSLSVAKTDRPTLRGLLLSLENHQADGLEIRGTKDQASVRFLNRGLLAHEIIIDPAIGQMITNELRALAPLDQSHRSSFRFNAGSGLLGFSVTHLPAINQSLWRITAFNPAGVTSQLEQFSHLDRLGSLTQSLKAPSQVIIISAPPHGGLTSAYLSLLNFASHHRHPIISFEREHRFPLPNIMQTEFSSQTDVARTISAFSPSVVGLENPDLHQLPALADLPGRGTSLIIALCGQSLLSTLRRISSRVPHLFDHPAVALHLERIPLLCQECRAFRRLERSEAHRWLRPNDRVALPVGCNHCHDGFQNHQLVAELLPLDHTNRQLLKNHTHHELIHRARGQGFRTISEQLIPLVQDGLIPHRHLVRP